MSAKAEGRAMIALVAVFALFVQALIPGFAAAAPRVDDGATAICTAHGLQPQPTDDGGVPASPALGHACDHCVCPTAAAPPPVTASVTPVTYAYARPAPPPAPERSSPRARGPPRPPGQGPPLPNA